MVTMVIIIVIVLSLIFAFFATQNTSGVTLRIGATMLVNLPLYLVVLGSLLVGFLISWIFSLIDSLSSKFTIHGKDSTIKQTKKTVVDLTKKVHQLELENAKLETELRDRSEGKVDDKSL